MTNERFYILDSCEGQQINQITSKKDTPKDNIQENELGKMKMNNLIYSSLKMK